jgi:hypothetical protein
MTAAAAAGTTSGSFLACDGGVPASPAGARGTGGASCNAAATAEGGWGLLEELSAQVRPPRPPPQARQLQATKEQLAAQLAQAQAGGAGGKGAAAAVALLAAHVGPASDRIGGRRGNGSGGRRGGGGDC